MTAGVDIDWAVHTVRRFDRRLRVATLAAVALAVAATSGAVAAGFGGGHRPDGQAATPDCTGPPTVTALTPPPVAHHGLRFTGADPSGRYLVGVANVGTPERHTARSVLWVDGSPSLIDPPPQGGSELAFATDVNGAGLVVGGDASAGAWTYRDGEFRRLPAVPGYEFYNQALVNERGDVVTTALARDGDTPSTTTPSVGVLWPADSPGEPRLLRAPGWVTVNGIAGDGTVLGRVGDDSSGRGGKPYAWSPAGQARALAVPHGWDGGASAAVRDGRIVGYLVRDLPPPSPAAATRVVEFEVAPAEWPLGGDGAEVGPAVVGVGVRATDAGWLSVRRLIERTSHVVLVAPDGRERPLDTPHGSEFRMVDAWWVSEDGRTVVGTAESASTPRPGERPVVWRC